MSTDQSDPSPPPHPPPRPQPPSHYHRQPPATLPYRRRPPASEPTHPLPTVNPKRRAAPVPFAYPPLLPTNSSSTSLLPNTAEGRPIPVDNSTAADRTSALRELNSHYPSRHRYAKSSGAQTNSQPVLVRTWTEPSSSRPVSANRGGVFAGALYGRGAAPSTAGGASLVRRMIPSSAPKHGLLGMAWAKTKRQTDGDMAQLPPMEAFTFKSFMANIEPPPTGNDINADLDRIAEICARSRYSLSNQYEVHKAPHGSGVSFLTTVSSSSRSKAPPGPTLQAISSDDEKGTTRQRRRRAGRRRSVAMGTLETIMSSSRSSDEDKTKKKSAAEITDEVRGRAARKGSGSSSPTSASQSDAEAKARQEKEEEEKDLAKRKSASFATAVIENTRHKVPSNPNSPRSSATALLSEPALPQTSTSHLEVRPALEEPPVDIVTHASHFDRSPNQRLDERPPPHLVEADHEPQGSLLSSLTGWISWRASPASENVMRERTGVPLSVAEGSLRDLLKTTDGKVSIKGKGIERTE